MGRMYSARFLGSTVSATTAYDVFSLKTGSSTIAMLHALYLSQNVLAQDANDAQISYEIRIGATTQGSGGGTPASVASPRETTTSGVTAHSLDTTQAGTGTIVIPHSDAFNDRAGLIFIPTPRMQELLVWSPSTCLVVAFPNTNSKTYTSGFNGTVVWEEF